MKEIIAPVPKELLKAELTEDKLLRFTHRSNNEIYVVTAFDAPNVMREIGRLREIAFRAAGGGTGNEVDIDEFDTMEVPYRQLIVWNPECDDIIGGYRFLYGKDVRIDENGEPVMATAHGMFHFSEKFLNEILPNTVELGRAFVALEYQSTRMGSKSLFALDNLWDGLGALTVVLPVLSAMGIQACPVPTAVLSTHTGGFDNMASVFPDADVFFQSVMLLARKSPVKKTLPDVTHCLL